MPRPSKSAPRRARAPKPPPPRRRRTAEDARAAILDAAERRLVTSGPAGIRLQEVAADVGVSHPTVLHHFGSREALVREVCLRQFAAIHADLVGSMSNLAGPEAIGAVLESVAKGVRMHGHARAVFWLALEGMFNRNVDDHHLREIGLVAQHVRTQKRDGRVAPLDDTLNVLALSTLALLAEAVIGPHIFGDLGLGDDEKAGARFRAWLSRLLADHLEHGPRD